MTAVGFFGLAAGAAGWPGANLNESAARRDSGKGVLGGFRPRGECANYGSW